MKNKLFLSVFVLIITSVTMTAQVKLKGNKEVTTTNRIVSEFNKIEVIDNIKVFLSYNTSPSVSVETDSNLQDAVLTEVVNGVLTIKIDDKIQRSKELAVHIRINNSLNEMYAYNNAKIFSNNLLEIDTLVVNAFDSSDFNLKLRSNRVLINAKKNTKLDFEILCDETEIRLEESANLKAVIDTKNCLVNLMDRANFTISGSTDELDVECNGNTTFKGRGFASKTTVVRSSNNADVYLNVKNILDIYATNSSEVYIYDNPEIKIHEFFDKAKLHKRD